MPGPQFTSCSDLAFGITSQIPFTDLVPGPQFTSCSSTGSGINTGSGVYPGSGIISGSGSIGISKTDSSDGSSNPTAW